MNNVCNRIERQVIFKYDSVESDCRGKSYVNETADQYIVYNHSTRGNFSKLYCIINRIRLQLIDEMYRLLQGGGAFSKIVV